MPMPTPTDVRRDGDAIVWTWSDGRETRWPATKLRDACPCATCREKKRSDDDAPAKPKGLPMLSLAEAKPTTVMNLEPAGNYAYQIEFSDGHHSGLFTLELLHAGP